MALASFEDSAQLRSSPRYRSGLNVNLKKEYHALYADQCNVLYSRIGITFLVMMQGIAVKYHASILWDVHSFVSEVLSCVMGSTHPKWSVNTLNLSMREWSGPCYFVSDGYIRVLPL